MRWLPRFHFGSRSSDSAPDSRPTATATAATATACGPVGESRELEDSEGCSGCADLRARLAEAVALLAEAGLPLSPPGSPPVARTKSVGRPGEPPAQVAPHSASVLHDESSVPVAASASPPLPDLRDLPPPTEAPFSVPPGATADIGEMPTDAGQALLLPSDDGVGGQIGLSRNLEPAGPVATSAHGSPSHPQPSPAPEVEGSARVGPASPSLPSPSASPPRTAELLARQNRALHAGRVARAWRWLMRHRT